MRVDGLASRYKDRGGIAVGRRRRGRKGGGGGSAQTGYVSDRAGPSPSPFLIPFRGLSGGGMERKEVKWLESKQESPPRVLPPLDLGGRVTAATGGRLSLSLPACKSAVPVAIFLLQSRLLVFLPLVGRE